MLQDFVHMLPQDSLVLDAASGMGVNALFLAQRGNPVVALDISEVGLRLLRQRAAKLGVVVDTAVFDLTNPYFPPNCVDAILNFRFLERNAFPAYRQALRPGGLLFFETFLRTDADEAPRQPCASTIERCSQVIPPAAVRPVREQRRVGDGAGHEEDGAHERRDTGLHGRDQRGSTHRHPHHGAPERGRPRALRLRRASDLAERPQERHEHQRLEAQEHGPSVDPHLQEQGEDVREPESAEQRGELGGGHEGRRYRCAITRPDPTRIPAAIARVPIAAARADPRGAR